MDLSIMDRRVVDQMRTVGWAHALQLIADGMREDGAKCESENWTETAAALFDEADRVEDLSSGCRNRVAAAEERDKQAGCD